MSAFYVRRFDRTIDKKNELLNLAKIVFGDTWDIIKKKLEWQYFDNPNCREPPIYLALKDECIAGAMGYIPITFIANGSEVDAAWMIDAMTPPDFRRRGISNMLHDRMEHDFSLVLAKSISDMILPLDLKRNYVVIRPARYMVRIINYKRYLKAQLQMVNSVKDNIEPRFPTQKTMPLGLEKVEKFDQSFDEFCEYVKDKFKYMVKKDSSYLKWRYLDCPLADYTVLQSRSGNTLRGFVVLRTVRESGFKTGWIVDLLVNPLDSEGFNNLIDGCLKFFKDKHVSWIYTLASHRAIKNKLYKKLFLPKSSCACMIAKSGAESLALQSDAELWHVTEGDSDSELFRVHVHK